MLKIFSIHDVKAKCYVHPFFLPERGMAARSFSDCVNSSEHQFGQHPHDYTLFEMGTFDDSTGIITPHNSPLSVGNGLEFIALSPPQPDMFDGEGKTTVSDDPPIQPGTEG